MKKLFELERQGWDAISRKGDAGKRFYESILREGAVMLFPGGLESKVVNGSYKDRDLNLGIHFRSKMLR